MEYLLAGKSRCGLLFVGITNPDQLLTKDDPLNPHRSTPSANPFSYYERYLMVRDSLLEAGVPRADFEIVPFPINLPQLIPNYVPRGARFFVTVYDDWGRHKVRLLRDLGLDVDVMWERDYLDRFTSGTEVRDLMAAGGPWQGLVPPAVVRIVAFHGLDRRLRECR
jgi:nicotinamide mononucleotide adenylyltransferase